MCVVGPNSHRFWPGADPLNVIVVGIAPLTMPKRKPPLNRFTRRKQRDASQSSLDKWLESSGEAISTHNGDGLASLLSAAAEVNAVIIRSQEASSVVLLCERIVG
jgi:hypothetical protein